MATELQQNFFRSWANGTAFVLDLEASPKREFARIAKSLGWIGGDANWCQYWRTCFGEEYNYSPRPRISSPNHPSPPRFTVSRFPQDYAMSPDVDKKDEFFRMCHDLGVSVNSKTWRAHWKDYFHKGFQPDEFGEYRVRGPASKLQQLCFGVYAEFALNTTADVLEEFTRLQQQCKWTEKRTSREWRWCFGNIHPASPGDDDSDSHWVSVSSDSEPDRTVYTPSVSDDGGVLLDSFVVLSNVFERLEIDPKDPATNKKLEPPTKSKKLELPAKIKKLEPPATNKKHDDSGKSKKQRRAEGAEAYQADFGNLLGTDPKKLANWQRLCSILNIEPIPQSITQCKKSYKSVWVNLYDVVDHLRDPDTVPLRHFRSYGDFWRNAKGRNRIFPKEEAKKNAFLRVLLHRF
ncbi:hypothetical protein K504DRAFT_462284 [Pleomassaria siparia CBS 279.74]|uniref:Uncharacterized protein n=1 Tax=Pleomassaria siparia CBS 279.74 TaxID=1314801 RepID=A0A6G1KLX0_9PLEO|nr:hypothetical protein K504DRAFT_462284 [Pleomassaria siparia CBS 279.74]